MEEHKSYITDSTGRETELSQHGIYFARGGGGVAHVSERGASIG